jgi:hypothetical protein
MRAREFVESKQQVQEFAPIVAALGGALARGATTAGGALVKGAVGAAGKIGLGAMTAAGKIGQGAVNAAGKVAQGAATQIGKQPVGTVGTSGSTTTPTDNKPTSPQPPANIPTGTKIEPVVSQDPNKMGFKIGDAVFSLDTKDPKNAQVLTQLNQLAPKQS